jgi:hypothetical protein
MVSILYAALVKSITDVRLIVIEQATTDKRKYLNPLNQQSSPTPSSPTSRHNTTLTIPTL